MLAIKKWLCECSCGRRQVVDGYALRSGKSSKCKYSHNGIGKIRGEPETEEPQQVYWYKNRKGEVAT